jgi:hypothetical protein
VSDWERKPDAEQTVLNAIAHFRKENTHRLEVTQAPKRVLEVNSTNIPTGSIATKQGQCTRQPSTLAGNTVGPVAFAPTLVNTAAIRVKATTTAPRWTIDKAEATPLGSYAHNKTPGTISRPVPTHNRRKPLTKSTNDNEGRLANNVVRLI